jgi:hypothetical protein
MASFLNKNSQADSLNKSINNEFTESKELINDLRVILMDLTSKISNTKINGQNYKTKPQL